MRYLIDFKNDVDQATIDSYASANGCVIVQTFDKFEKTFLVECDQLPPSADFIEHVIEDNTETLKLLGDTYPLSNQIEISNFAVQDPKNWWKSYTFSGVDFDSLEASFLRNGRGGKVYVLDSGIAARHPEFEGRNVELLHSFLGTDFADRVGHGTAMASVIVGNTCGITDATIKVVKIFDPSRKILLSEMLVALNAVITDHVSYANNEKNVSVANLSWSVERNTWLESKIKTLIDVGICVVTSAGNEGVPITDRTPAAMPEVITVGAYNEDLTPCDFSNYTGQSEISYTAGAVNHGQLDIWAPGSNVWAALPGGSYGFVAGTSISAAIQSATMVSVLSTLTTQQLGSPGFLAFVSSTVDRFYNVRSNILILENQYAECVNLISTLRLMDDYIDTQTTIFYYGQGGNNKLLLFANQEFARMLLNPNQWKSITFDKPFPDGVSFVGGEIRGQWALGEGEQYQKHTYNVTIIDKDDVEIQKSFDIIIWHDSSTLNQDLMNNPALQEELQVDLALQCDNGACFGALMDTGGYWGCGCCVNIYGIYYNKTYGVPAGRCFCYTWCP